MPFYLTALNLALTFGLGFSDGHQDYNDILSDQLCIKGSLDSTVPFWLGVGASVDSKCLTQWTVNFEPSAPTYYPDDCSSPNRCFSIKTQDRESGQDLYLSSLFGRLSLEFGSFEVWLIEPATAERRDLLINLHRNLNYDSSLLCSSNNGELVWSMDDENRFCQWILDTKTTKKPAMNWNTDKPTKKPTMKWSTMKPTKKPTEWDTMKPTMKPTKKWSTMKPTKKPTEWTTKKPTKAPTKWTTKAPTKWPTKAPEWTTKAPTKKPTKAPTEWTTKAPNTAPTEWSTMKPTKAPTKWTTKAPTKSPTKAPTEWTTKAPTKKPTKAPTEWPTNKPTKAPTKWTTKAPTEWPTKAPTKWTTKAPTKKPTEWPTMKPTKAPTKWTTMKPTKKPTNKPTEWSTMKPTKKPTEWSTMKPTKAPTKWSTMKPTKKPTMKWSTERPTKHKRSLIDDDETNQVSNIGDIVNTMDTLGISSADNICIKIWSLDSTVAFWLGEGRSVDSKCITKWQIKFEISSPSYYDDCRSPNRCFSISTTGKYGDVMYLSALIGRLSPEFGRFEVWFLEPAPNAEGRDLLINMDRKNNYDTSQLCSSSNERLVWESTAGNRFCHWVLDPQ